MLSKEVLTELDVLKTELENISSSIKYIDKASEVAQRSSTVINKISDLANRIEVIQKEHFDILNKFHKKKVESVQESLKEVIANSNSTLMENQNALKYHIDELSNFHKTEVESLRQSFNSVIEKSESKIVEIQSLVKSTESINSSIRAYFEKISGIDFPSRLDKIDNQISSINIGIGNLQTSIQRLNNLTNEKFEKLTTTNVEFKTELGILNRNVKTNRIIIIVGLVIIVSLLSYLAFK